MKKVVLVTGASGNLGKAVVEKFLKENCLVYGTQHQSLIDDGENLNENFIPTELDLLNENDARHLVHQIIESNGKVDAAVLTAGGFTMNDIAKTSSKDLYQQYQLNFGTAYNIARPVFVQMMKQNYGRIFLIGSQAGLDVSQGKGVTAYALSKSLLFRLAELMNAEAKEKNVSVIVIVPSTIDTPQNRKDMPDADFSKWVKSTEIADVIYFYTTPEADITKESVVKVYRNS